MLTKKDLQSISQLTRAILKEELKPVDKKIDKLQRTSEKGFNILDKDYIHTTKRVDRIEDHLGLPPLKRVN